MSIDDKQSDKDLAAYLDGRDGVSAAYRKTAQEEPPRALDEAILKAARRQVQPSTEKWYASRKPYALAASVMLGVIAISLYFNALDEVVLPAAERQEAFIAVEVQRAQQAETGRSEREEADTAAAAEQARAEAQFEARTLAPEIPTVAAPPPAPAAAGVAAPPVGASESTARRATEAPIAVIDGPLLERIEAEAAQAQSVEQAQAVEQAQDASAEPELEEITVTGSRIARRDANDVSYRESQEAWLEEIRFRMEELRQLARRTGNTVFQERTLQDEIDLFTEAYPDFDLDAALAEEE